MQINSMPTSFLVAVLKCIQFPFWRKGLHPTFPRKFLMVWINYNLLYIGPVYYLNISISSHQISLVLWNSGLFAFIFIIMIFKVYSMLVSANVELKICKSWLPFFGKYLVYFDDMENIKNALLPSLIHNFYYSYSLIERGKC